MTLYNFYFCRKTVIILKDSFDNTHRDIFVGAKELHNASFARNINIIRLDRWIFTILHP